MDPDNPVVFKVNLSVQPNSIFVLAADDVSIAEKAAWLQGQGAGLEIW